MLNSDRSSPSTPDRATVEAWLHRWIAHAEQQPTPLKAQIHQELLNLRSIQQQLHHPVLTVASFGLVSRGKSAVCNALLGEKRWATGALHGVTRWPRSLRWQQLADFDVDLVDTPGLDEVAGEERQRMTEAIVAEADLILFVLQATLTELEQTILKAIDGRKPLILVLNKIDLYRPSEQPQILLNLQQEIQALLGRTDIPPLVAVTADPQPQRVQLQWPDGRLTEQWETPAPDIVALQEVLQASFTSIALPQFVQYQQTQGDQQLQAITAKMLAFYGSDRDRLQNRFWQGRMLWVALSPWVMLDVVGALFWDLLFIRNLGKLYQWPLTSQGLALLWKTIVQNLLILALGEWLGRILGPGDWAALGTGGLPLSILGSLAIQSLWAGYGGLRIADAAEEYFKTSYTLPPPLPPASELIPE